MQISACPPDFSPVLVQNQDSSNICSIFNLRRMSGAPVLNISPSSKHSELIRPTLHRRQCIISLAVNFSVGITCCHPTQPNYPRSQGFMSSLARDRYRGMYHQPTAKSALMFHQESSGEASKNLFHKADLQ